MAASEVDIWNIALARLGQSPLNAPDQDGKAAALCRRLYPASRDAVLRAYPWNCAVRRALLGASTIKPAFGFARYFDLPEGPDDEQPKCLRVLNIDGDIERKIVWKVEGRRLATDEAGPLPIIYIGRLADPTAFDPLVDDAIAMRMALGLCVPLTSNASLLEGLRGEYREILIEARRVDAQEGSADDLVADEWLISRL